MKNAQIVNNFIIMNFPCDWVSCVLINVINIFLINTNILWLSVSSLMSKKCLLWNKTNVSSPKKWYMGDMLLTIIYHLPFIVFGLKLPSEKKLLIMKNSKVICEERRLWNIISPYMSSAKRKAFRIPSKPKHTFRTYVNNTIVSSVLRN